MPIMLDSGFRDFAIVAAALVISPGASMAVVTEVALQRGRPAALLTVVGVNVANSILALASMLGLSAIFHHWPSLIRIISVAGALYLTYLGLCAFREAKRGNGAVGRDRVRPQRRVPLSAFARGMLTNFLNPSVILFYMLLLPQFVRGSDPFFERFLLLAAAHVTMSLVWLSSYAIAVGTLSERMARAGVRRGLQILTGAVLVFLGVKLVFR